MFQTNAANTRELVSWITQLLLHKREPIMCSHKRNSELINSLLGLPKLLNEAGKKWNGHRIYWYTVKQQCEQNRSDTANWSTCMLKNHYFVIPNIVMYWYWCLNVVNIWEHNRNLDLCQTCDLTNTNVTVTRLNHSHGKECFNRHHRSMLI